MAPTQMHYGDIADECIKVHSTDLPSPTSSTTSAGSSNVAQLVPRGAPYYLLHGFRWPRDNLRVHVISHNVDDGAPDYTMKSDSNEEFIRNLRKNYPSITKNLPFMSMVEEFNPWNESPYHETIGAHAWLADLLVLLDPDYGATEGEDTRTVGPMNDHVDALMKEGIPPEAWEAIAELRDKLAPGEDVGWWIIFNGDPEGRLAEDEDDDDDDEDDEMEYDEEGNYIGGGFDEDNDSQATDEDEEMCLVEAALFPLVSHTSDSTDSDSSTASTATLI